MEIPPDTKFEVRLYGHKPEDVNLEKIKNSFTDLKTIEFDSDGKRLFAEAISSQAAPVLKRALDNYFGGRFG